MPDKNEVMAIGDIAKALENFLIECGEGHPCPQHRAIDLISRKAWNSATQASKALRCLATADQAEREIGHDIDAELLQFKRDSLRRKLDACTQKERDFFWYIWKNAPCKATTPEELPEKHLMDSLRLCDRTLKAALQSPVTAGGERNEQG